jgi:HPt (histidine-containing phosphotransfer) domain-containing protein
MKGGAAVCFAVELAAACARLEDVAKQRVQRDSGGSSNASGPTVAATTADLVLLVERVAADLDKLAHYVKAVGAVHMLPFHELKNQFGDHTDGIVAVLSALIEATVKVGRCRLTL